VFRRSRQAHHDQVLQRAQYSNRGVACHWLWAALIGLAVLPPACRSKAPVPPEPEPEPQQFANVQYEWDTWEVTDGPRSNFSQLLELGSSDLAAGHIGLFLGGDWDGLALLHLSWGPGRAWRVNTLREQCELEDYFSATTHGDTLYAAYAPGALFFQTASAGGTEWSDPVQITEHYSCNSSLAIDAQGVPCVAYCFYANQLGFVRAADPSGTAWREPVSVREGYVYANPTLLILAGGTPAIVYYHTSDQAMYFITALDNFGLEWYEPILLDSGDTGVGVVGGRTAVVWIDNLPALAYAFNNGSLRYTRALDWQHTQWSTPITIAHLGNPTLHARPAMVLFNGRPVVCFENNGVRLVQALDRYGDDWSEPQLVIDNGGGCLSMLAHGRRLYVSYLKNVTQYIDRQWCLACGWEPGNEPYWLNTGTPAGGTTTQPPQ